MKSRKYLKKELKKSFDELYKDVFFYEAFVVNANGGKAQALLNKMLETENDFLKRISVNEGKYVKGRVKMYFTKLRGDLDKHLQEFKKEIVELEH